MGMQSCPKTISDTINKCYKQQKVVLTSSCQIAAAPAAGVSGCPSVPASAGTPNADVIFDKSSECWSLAHASTHKSMPPCASAPAPAQRACPGLACTRTALAGIAPTSN